MSLSEFAKFVQKIRSNFIFPSVSVLVPAHNAQEFICETLDSLNNQIFKCFQIIISIDKSDDETGLVVEKWCKQHKQITTKIFYQEHNLGWVKNINFLLKKCETKYFMMLPHDDLIHKTYLQKMFQYLEAHPSTCVAYSDIQGFGAIDLYVFQKSITGDKKERTLNFLLYHHSAIAIRGLVNRTVLSDLIFLYENNFSNIAMDSVWNMQMALMGEVIRIPEVLYYKRYHGDSVHAQWWQAGKKDSQAWLEHCTDCIKLILLAGFKQEELVHLIRSVKSRLVQKHPLCPNPELLRLDSKEQDLLIEAFEKNIIKLCKSKNNQILLKS